MTITLLNGLTYGGLLFIVSVGFSLIFGVMRVVNLAHGAMYLLSAYIGLEVWIRSDNWWLAVLIAAVALAIVALGFEQIIQLVEGDMPQTLLTLGLTLAISDAALWIWGGLPQTLTPPPQLTGVVEVFGVKFPGFRLFIFFLAAALGIIMWILMTRTQLGRLLRAGVDDRQMLAATGVNVRYTFSATWILGGLMVGIAGAVGGSYISFGPGTEFNMLTLALVVVIIGGMGSIGGSAVGAIIVGLVDAFGRTYVDQLSSFLLMGTLVIVLAIRPQGIFGRSD